LPQPGGKEWIEHPAQVFWSDPHAIVGKCKDDLRGIDIGSGFTMPANSDLAVIASFKTVADAIEYQVDHDLF